MISKIIYSALVCCFFISPLFGQDVEIKHTDMFKSVVQNGETINKFLGHVKLRRENADVSCDSAFQYVDRKNSLRLMGNVGIVESDTLFLDCDKIYYDGDAQFLTAEGDVRLRDPGIQIETDKLYYSGKNKTAHYNSGGEITMPGYTLTSKQAFYYLGEDYIRFKDSVFGKGDTETIKGDSLDYYTKEKKVVFLGPTEVLSEDGRMNTSGGEYYTREKRAFLTERSMIEDSSFLIWGDTLYYEQLNKNGRGNGKIKLFSKKENILLLGDAFINRGDEGFSKVWGAPVVRWANEKDTLWIKADTLIRETSEGRDVLRCYNNVSIFRESMQGICDSLVYHISDSNLVFYDDPVLWTGMNQMSSDTIIAFMAGNRLEKVKMNRKAFVVNKDSLENYNQIKGRNMDASFDSLGLQKIDISGNGESIYFVIKEKDGSTMGMNRVWCSNMVMDFEGNKLKDIHFLVRPDAKFIPPHELEGPESVLRGFIWREMERPEKIGFSKPW
jgi:lipopolysaccharide export system protein LptA